MGFPLNDDEYTPGPWKIETDTDKDSGAGIESAAGLEVVTGGAREGLFSGSDPVGVLRQADARLIAAAPELLDCCKDALDAFGHHGVEGSLCEAIQRVIDKATDAQKESKS